MKKKFRVWAKSTDYCYLDVEANSKEEAEEIAENSDGGDFEVYHLQGDWIIRMDLTEEIK